MKRFLCLSLVFLIALSLSACKKEKEKIPSEPTNNTYDLVECMKQGKIPELKYTLGTSPETIKKDFEGVTEQDGEEIELYINENPNSTNIVAGNYYYYYVNGSEDMGISSIVSFSTAFGVEVNGFETKQDIIKKFSTVDFEDRELSSLQAYFIPGEIENCSALTCKTDNRRIDFIFIEETLIAINLLDTENWTLS